MTHHKKNSLSVLLVVLIAAIILTGCYFTLQGGINGPDTSIPVVQIKPTKPTPTTTTPKSPAAQGVLSDSSMSDGWKLYKNSALGFEVSVPANITIVPSEIGKTLFFKSNDQDFEISLVDASTHGGSLNNYQYLSTKAGSEGLLGGKKASVFSIPAYGEGGEKFPSSVTVATDKGGYFYNITFLGDLRISDSERRVLNSFKFTQ